MCFCWKMEKGYCFIDQGKGWQVNHVSEIVSYQTHEKHKFYLSYHQRGCHKITAIYTIEYGFRRGFIHILCISCILRLPFLQMGMFFDEIVFVSVKKAGGTWNEGRRDKRIN